MISIHCGVPGSGKSYFAMCRMYDQLRCGGVVASNINFSSGWIDRCSFNPLSKFFPSRLASYSDKLDLWQRNFRVSSAQDIMDLSSILPDLSSKINVNDFCPLGLLVIDECQLLFNSRDWNKNFDYVKLFTIHRKLRWDIILIAHDLEMIDKQIRFLTEIEVHFRNVKGLKIPGTPVPLSPVDAFLVIHQYSNMATKGKINSRLHFLDKSIASMYDSMQFMDFQNNLSYQGPPPSFRSTESSVLRYRQKMRKKWHQLHVSRIISGSPYSYDILR